METSEALTAELFKETAKDLGESFLKMHLYSPERSRQEPDRLFLMNEAGEQTIVRGTAGPLEGRLALLRARAASHRAVAGVLLTDRSPRALVEGQPSPLRTLSVLAVWPETGLALSKGVVLRWKRQGWTLVRFEVPVRSPMDSWLWGILPKRPS